MALSNEEMALFISSGWANENGLDIDKFDIDTLFHMTPKQNCSKKFSCSKW